MVCNGESHYTSGAGVVSVFFFVRPARAVRTAEYDAAILAISVDPHQGNETHPSRKLKIVS
jgi:hypothetical protein